MADQAHQVEPERTLTARGDGAPRASRGPAALEAAAVSHRFAERLVLRDVSLAVGRGEVHALLGPNGAGKTTLLRALMGLLAPTAGTIRVLGRDVSGRPADLLARVSLVPSGDRSFYNRISGLENLRFFARLHGMSAREARRRAQEVLEAVDLSDAAGRRVGTYSHGMQKRLSMARALMSRPDVLLVDEVTHDLDPEAVARACAIVRRAADEGAAVLWTTQRLEEIDGLADAVTLIDAGDVRFHGSVPDLLANARSHRFVLGLPDVGREELARLEGVLAPAATLDRLPGEDDRYLLVLAPGAVLGDAIAVIAGEGTAVLSCREERSPLETAFLSLVRGEGG